MTIAISLDAYPIRLKPTKGESLMGYLWRFYASNGSEVPVPVRILATQARRGQCRPIDFSWMWSAIGKQTTEELLTSESSAMAAIQRRSRLPWAKWPRTSRFCPLCIREKQSHLLVMDLPLVEACPKHGIRLIQHCPGCSASLCWSSLRHGWLCRCGLAISDMATAKVPSWLHRMSSFVANAACEGVLRDAYAELVWATELRHRVAYGDRYACQVHVDEQGPTKWLRKPSRWEIDMAEQSTEGLARGMKRMLRRLFADAETPVIELTANTHVSGLIAFALRTHVLRKERMSAISSAWAGVLHGLSVHESKPKILYHPCLLMSERHRNDATLQAWWLKAWPFAGQVAEWSCADVRESFSLHGADALIVQLVSDLLKVTRRTEWTPGSSVLAARWKPSAKLTDAGRSVTCLVQALSQLPLAELSFVAALVRYDLVLGSRDDR